MSANRNRNPQMVRHNALVRPVVSFVSGGSLLFRIRDPIQSRFRWFLTTTSTEADLEVYILVGPAFLCHARQYASCTSFHHAAWTFPCDGRAIAGAGLYPYSELALARCTIWWRNRLRQGLRTMAWDAGRLPRLCTAPSREWGATPESRWLSSPCPSPSERSLLPRPRWSVICRTCPKPHKRARKRRAVCGGGPTRKTHAWDCRCSCQRSVELCGDCVGSERGLSVANSMLVRMGPRSEACRTSGRPAVQGHTLRGANTAPDRGYQQDHSL